jgi:magnesium-transporting ATPase (P-type)
LSPPPLHGWSVPQPPPGPQRPIRTRRVFAGIGLVFGAQIVAILLGVLAVVIGNQSDDSDNALLGYYLEVALQVVLFIACLVLGIVWIARRDRGLGIGLLIGWGVTVLVFPVVGIGVCIALLNQGQL